MRRLVLIAPPQRMVSLVPSLTESVFELGFGDSLVGVTDFCVHPAEKVAALPRLGGPKNPDLEAILGLKPDLVLINKEENSRAAVETLEARGVAVGLTFPHLFSDTSAVQNGRVHLVDGV